MAGAPSVWRTEKSAKYSGVLTQKDIAAAIGEKDEQVHEDEDQVVMPAGGFFSPEAGVPDEDFFLDGAEHDEDEADGGDLGEDAEGNSEGAGHLADAENDGESLAHSDAAGAGFGIFQVAVAAGGEDKSDHQADQQEAEIGEAGELGEHEASSQVELPPGAEIPDGGEMASLAGRGIILAS